MPAKKRRDAGSGTIRLRADGRWEGRYYYKGTGKYKSVYGKTMTEAKEKLDKLRNEAFTPSRNCHYLVSDVMKNIKNMKIIFKIL